MDRDRPSVLAAGAGGSGGGWLQGPRATSSYEVSGPQGRARQRGDRGRQDRPRAGCVHVAGGGRPSPSQAAPVTCDPARSRRGAHLRRRCRVPTVCRVEVRMSARREARSLAPSVFSQRQPRHSLRTAVPAVAAQPPRRTPAHVLGAGPRVSGGLADTRATQHRCHRRPGFHHASRRKKANTTLALCSLLAQGFPRLHTSFQPRSNCKPSFLFLFPGNKPWVVTTGSGRGAGPVGVSAAPCQSSLCGDGDRQAGGRAS